MEYGIEGPGGCVRPTEAEALRLLNQALDAGINLFDTAPSYGDSERLLGQALGRGDGSYVATKVSIPRDGNGRPLRGGGLHRAVEASLEASLRALNREALDIVQIHNATVEVLARGEMAEALLGAKRHGKVRYLGASVYTEAEALAVVEAGCFDVLQVAYSVLDQRMAKRVFSVAEEAGVGLMVRSSLLKGALTPRAQWLPPQLSLLYQAAEQAKELLAGSWQALPEVAVRFCLSPRQVATVLVGPRTESELNQALAAAEAGPLSEALVARALTLALADERLLNPSLWSSALATGTEG
jgi:aryl-alcohol dehydrogenase-like predicted oxidoreductase